MLTDLVQIRRLGDKQREENLRFRMHLKRHVFVEKRLRRIAEKYEDEMDCTTCANCCKVATTKVTERDVKRLARFLHISEQRFLTGYCVESEEEGVILKRNEQGCVFLDGMHCTVYENRPHTCENFPHMVRGEGSLVSRMWHMPDRAVYCPIVYNTLEEWKDEVGFRR
jgi:hypothetical protein